EAWKHLLGSKLPDQFEGLFVPIRELLIEVAQENLMADRIMADRDADRLEVKAVVAIEATGELENELFGRGRRGIAERQQGIAANRGAGIIRQFLAPVRFSGQLQAIG